jgi:hypothetical protein
MKSMIIALLLLAGAAQAQRLRIDLVVLNSAGTVTQQIDRISLTTGQTARVSAAVPAGVGAIAWVKQIIRESLVGHVEMREMELLRAIRQAEDDAAEAAKQPLTD